MRLGSLQEAGSRSERLLELSPGQIEEGGVPQTAELPELETAVIIAALQKTPLGKLVQTIVFAHNTDLLAHWGDLNITQAATVALVVGDKWQAAPNKTLVQFIHLAAKAGLGPEDWRKGAEFFTFEAEVFTEKEMRK